MFNKKTMVLYCGGASSLAPNAPASPGAGGGGVAGGGGGGGGPPHPETGVVVGVSGPGPSLPLRAGHLWGAPQGFFPEGGRSLMGGGSRAAGGCPPLPLIGPLEGAPRAAIGCGAETPTRPASLLAWPPERELDGCEPDSGGDEEDDEEEEEGGGRSQEGGGRRGRRGGGRGRGSELEGIKEAASSSSSPSSSSSSSPLSSEGIPSPCSTLDSLPDPEPEEEEEEEEGKKKEEKSGVASSSSSSSAGAAMASEDHLRRITLEVVSRYLHEAAGQGAKDGGGGGGLGGPKFSLQGLLGRLGANPQGEAEAEAEAEAGATRALETLRRVGDSILEKHQLAFQGMLRKMEIKKEEDLKTMSEVATEVFRDGIINWGRIVTLISFGAFVAKHLKSINLEGSINTLTEIITDVLVTDKREWLVSHNAWEGFVKFFHVEDIEGGIRSVLMTFAGVAGLGAGLAFMIR